MRYTICIDKHISAAEYSALMESVGWGAGYQEDDVRQSINAYPFIAHARSAAGEMVGFVSAFSDGAFSTMMGELVVHPAAQGHGVGRALLKAVDSAYPGVPVYAKPVNAAAAAFFLACGYRVPKAPMHVLVKGSAGLR